MVETQFADDDASVNRRSAPRGQRAGVQNAHVSGNIQASGAGAHR